MFRITIFFILYSTIVKGQDTLSSTLKDVVITSYFKSEQQFYQPVSAMVIDSVQLKNSRDQSLIPLVNLKAGIRMEERSPGSFRFSIRGSLLRSPFGVRNVKFYFNEFPFTDAGGNTYLNLFDHSIFSGIEILKGPDGSVFGANSGGVVRLLLIPSDDSTSIKFRMNGGSYGEAYQSVKAGLMSGKHHVTIFESYRRNDGYRANSSMKKFNALISDKIMLTDNFTVDASAFISSLNYRTPGGLTKLQAENDPKQSRPASITLPSAVDQKAGVENKTGWLGAQMKYKFSSQFTFLFNLSAIHTDFKNPFITNFEKRNENGLNGRMWFMSENKNVHTVRYKFVAGLEGGSLSSKINNSGNQFGIAANLLASDNIINKYLVLFSSATIYVGTKINGQFSISENLNSVSINSIFPLETGQRFNYDIQLMPRFALSYSPKNFILLRGVIAKGYSVPTSAEIRPSGNVVNTSLQPEIGWNYEAGLRLKTNRKLFSTDISVFDYILSNTISRRTNDNDTEYFINGGKTSQRGIEIQSELNLSLSKNKFIDLILRNGITLNDFRFVDFISGETDLSGKKLTGVPDHLISSSIEIIKKADWSFTIVHFFSGKIPLNDLTSDVGSENHLVNLKAEKYFFINKIFWSLFFQIENLSDASYSSGYDLNAYGGRYFNPAPGRTFSVGICLEYAK